MTRRLLMFLGLCAALGGCAPDEDPLPPVPMRSLCGQEPGPIQLLELEVDEDVSTMWRHGDRWLLRVDTYEEPVLDPPAFGESQPLVVDARIVSVDVCGDDPREVFAGHASLSRHGSDDAPVWTTCTGLPSELLVFDDVDAPPRSIAPGCPLHAVLGRDVVFEQVDGDQQHSVWVVSLDAPADARPELVGMGSFAGSWLSPDGRREVFRRYGPEVLTFDLEAGTDEAIATLDPLDPLEEVWIDRGRYIRITETEDPNFRIVDRQTGLELAVDAPPEVDADGRRIGTLWASRPGLLTLRRTGGSAAVWLPELQSARTEDDWLTVHRAGDRLAIVKARDFGRDLYVLDRGEDTARLRQEAIGPVIGYEDDAVLVMRRPVKSYDPQDLLAVPLDGGEPIVVAQQLGHSRRLSDDRWATTRRGSRDEPASLLVVDAEGDALGRIEDNAAPGVGPTPAPNPAIPTDALVYTVRGPDRRGVWYAELP